MRVHRTRNRHPGLRTGRCGDASRSRSGHRDRRRGDRPCDDKVGDGPARHCRTCSTRTPFVASAPCWPNVPTRSWPSGIATAGSCGCPNRGPGDVRTQTGRGHRATRAGTTCTPMTSPAPRAGMPAPCTARAVRYTRARTRRGRLLGRLRLDGLERGHALGPAVLTITVAARRRATRCTSMTSRTGSPVSGSRAAPCRPTSSADIWNTCPPVRCTQPLGERAPGPGVLQQEDVQRHAHPRQPHGLAQGRLQRLGHGRPVEHGLVADQVGGRLAVGDHDHLLDLAGVVGEQAAGQQERVLHVGAVHALEPGAGEVRGLQTPGVVGEPDQVQRVGTVLALDQGVQRQGHALGRHEVALQRHRERQVEQQRRGGGGAHLLLDDLEVVGHQPEGLGRVHPLRRRAS